MSHSICKKLRLDTKGADGDGFASAFMWMSQSKFKTYDCTPWGGWGGFEISLYLDYGHHLQNTTMDAVGRVGVDLDSHEFV